MNRNLRLLRRLFKLYRVPILAFKCGEWRAPWQLWLYLWRDDKCRS